MFDREMLDRYFTELREKYATEPDWEQLVRDSHLGIARSDASVDLGDVDGRIKDLIDKHK